MKRNSLIVLTSLMVMITGCSQNSEKENGISGKLGLCVDYKEILNSLTEGNTQDKDDKLKVEKHTEEDDENNESSRANTSVSESNSSTQKQTVEKRAVNKSEISSQPSQDIPDNDNSQQSKNEQSQETSQQQKEEPSKPTEQVKPEPPVSVCDNTIPSGAYPIERESEIDAQIQAEMKENQIHGDGTFKGYEVEYGSTDCGTEYFIIIYHKY